MSTSFLCSVYEFEGADIISKQGWVNAGHSARQQSRWIAGAVTSLMAALLLRQLR